LKIIYLCGVDKMQKGFVKRSLFDDEAYPKTTTRNRSKPSYHWDTRLR